MKVAVSVLLVLLMSSTAVAQWYDNSRYRNDPVDLDLFTSSPEGQQIDSDLLEAAVDDFVNSRVKSVVISCNNNVVFERYYNGANKQQAGNLHSASKSILGVLAFQMVDDGLLDLDEPIANIMPQYFFRYGSNDGRRDITVRHLMQMASGLRWSEDNTEYSIGRGDTWVQDVLDQGLRYTPGSRFHYSTGNTHLLSAVLENAAQEPLEDYAQRQLFSELGILPERWVSDPEGYKCGGFNFYMTPREMLRFGLLAEQEGQYQGKRLVSADLMLESRRRGVASDYGLLWWRDTIAGHSVQQAWGWGSQMIYTVPDVNLVVVTTADHNSGRETDHQGLVRDILNNIDGYVDPEPTPEPEPEPTPEPEPEPTPEPQYNWWSWWGGWSGWSWSWW